MTTNLSKDSDLPDPAYRHHLNGVSTDYYTADQMRKAIAAQTAPTSEEMIRFCGHCGSLGEVDYKKHRDCCPDGNTARRIPKNMALRCKQLFDRALQAAFDEADAAPPTQAIAVEVVKDERAEFEKWAIEQDMNLTRGMVRERDYSYMQTDHAWRVWRGVWASLAGPTAQRQAIAVEAAWISVKDAMPELQSFVLVAIDDRYCDTDFDVRIASYTMKRNGKDRTFTMAGGADYHPKAITHWQPIPAAPSQGAKQCQS